MSGPETMTVPQPQRVSLEIALIRADGTVESIPSDQIVVRTPAPTRDEES